MRKIRLKYIIYAILILLFAVIIIFLILFQRNIRTAASVKKLEDGLYSMEYKGDSGFASTEWIIVYNQSTGEARYYHRENYQKYDSFIAGSP